MVMMVLLVVVVVVSHDRALGGPNDLGVLIRVVAQLVVEMLVLLLLLLVVLRYRERICVKMRSDTMCFLRAGRGFAVKFTS